MQTVTDTRAYHISELITAVKSFLCQVGGSENFRLKKKSNFDFQRKTSFIFKSGNLLVVVVFVVVYGVKVLVRVVSIVVGVGSHMSRAVVGVGGCSGGGGGDVHKSGNNDGRDVVVGSGGRVGVDDGV